MVRQRVNVFKVPIVAIRILGRAAGCLGKDTQVWVTVTVGPGLVLFILCVAHRAPQLLSHLLPGTTSCWLGYFNPCFCKGRVVRIYG